MTLKGLVLRALSIGLEMHPYQKQRFARYKINNWPSCVYVWLIMQHMHQILLSICVDLYIYIYVYVYVLDCLLYFNPVERRVMRCTLFGCMLAFRLLGGISVK